MLCEECKMREATIAMVVRMGKESTTRHLCAECMAEMNRKMTGGSLMNLLSGILTAISDHENEPIPEKSVVCESCGKSLYDFLESGKLGCANCYNAFREQLQPMLLRIHGRVQHAGRTPMRTETEENKKKGGRREELSRLMAQAVAVEDFETAAQLRDQLRLLSAEEEQA